MLAKLSAMTNRTFLVFLAAISMLSCSRRQPPADMIIYGGTIYTVTDVHPVVEAVVVQSDRILFAGPKEDAFKWKGDSTLMIDLAGQTMTPGFIEGHGHIMGVGYNELDLNLMDVKSYDELVERVKNAVAKAKPGEWILGRGWHQDKWDVKPLLWSRDFRHTMRSVQYRPIIRCFCVMPAAMLPWPTPRPWK